MVHEIFQINYYNTFISANLATVVVLVHGTNGLGGSVKAQAQSIEVRAALL